MVFGELSIKLAQSVSLQSWWCSVACGALGAYASRFRLARALRCSPHARCPCQSARSHGPWLPSACFGRGQVPRRAGRLVERLPGTDPVASRRPWKADSPAGRSSASRARPRWLEPWCLMWAAGVESRPSRRTCGRA